MRESSSAITAQQAEQAAAQAGAIVAAVEGFIQGKRETVELALTCLLAEGHLLIEDVPGVGKTSLARSLATALGMTWHRIQFTPDLLPSDVTGVSVFHQGSQSFEFHPGPVFASIVLADEINRASPRTQSALLEVMEERTVTVDGVSHPVPRPFLVLATQNPIDAEGTFPLPEAQVDRFLMSLAMGYPDPAAEARVLANAQAGRRVDTIDRVADPRTVLTLIDAARTVFVDPKVIDYVVAVVASTRSAPGVRLGASPRGSVALMRAAQASALMAGRHYVAPADAQRLAIPVLAHRIVLADTDALDTQATAVARHEVVRAAVDAVPAP
jgi:MoxR-like ATPase